MILYIYDTSVSLAPKSIIGSEINWNNKLYVLLNNDMHLLNNALTLSTMNFFKIFHGIKFEHRFILYFRKH